VIEAVYREHGRFVWGLCYRMTGNASDADDLVQETFARAPASPPHDTSGPWRPWLVSDTNAQLDGADRGAT